ncbi:MAG: ribosome maturation factor RimP [Clostridiales bacterium]|nr:ribosome maturation factor RimP [Clostridiales bacterium]
MKKKDGAGYVQDVANAAAREIPCRVVEVAFEKEPTGLYLRVYIDTDNGVTLNECERFHRLIQPKLENVTYDFLEVSSPGIDRPIRSLEEAQRALGQEVELRLYRPRDRQKVFVGRLQAFDGQTYTLTTPQGDMTFDHKEVAVARRTVDMSEAIELEGSDRIAPDPGTTQEET